MAFQIVSCFTYFCSSCFTTMTSLYGTHQVFIHEQKLYSKEQLDQHIKIGDSEVDETEGGRGAFKGHPLCKFSKSPFYGDDEIYMHMVPEHYKCDVCKG